MNLSQERLPEMSKTRDAIVLTSVAADKPILCDYNGTACKRPARWLVAGRHSCGLHLDGFATNALKYGNGAK
jgi:hypothetical protein